MENMLGGDIPHTTAIPVSQSEVATGRLTADAVMDRITEIKAFVRLHSAA